MPYPVPPAPPAMDVTMQSVSGEKHGGGGGGGGEGGADVQHAASISAVLLSTGSTVHGGTQATTRHTIRPMQSICWLHCPYRNWKHPVTQELQPSGPQPHVTPSHPVSQKPQPPPHPVVQPHWAWQSM